MKYLIIALLFLFSFNANSQCKNIIENTVDDFDGDHIAMVGTKFYLTYNLVGTKCKGCNSIGRFVIGKVNDEYYISLHIFYKDVWSVSKGNTVEIKMLDGGVFTFEVGKYEIASAMDSGPLRWNAFVLFPINKLFLNTIQEQGIDMIRVELNDGYATSRVAKPEQIKEFARCIEIIEKP